MMRASVFFFACLLAAYAYPADLDLSGSDMNALGSGMESSGSLKSSGSSLESSGSSLESSGSSLESSGSSLESSGSSLESSGYTLESSESILEASGNLEGSAVEIISEEEQYSIRNRRDVETVEGSGLESNATKTCAALTDCYSDSDCNGGICNGVFVGRCNCNACLNFWLCKSDSECGGLKGACTESGFCDCYGAYAKNNITLTDALTSLCNIQECTADNSASNCFGLPCNKGFCTC